MPTPSDDATQVAAPGHEAAAQDVQAEPRAQEPALQAHTEEPVAAPNADDIAKAASSAGDNPMLALGLAAMVVLGGGGAMWKFIQQRGKASAELDQKRADQDHELKLKELEIRATQSSSPDYSSTQPPSCQAATAKQDQAISSMGGRVGSLQEELEQLKTRLGRLEKRSASISADFDAEEVSEMVQKHDKDIRSLKASLKDR